MVLLELQFARGRAVYMNQQDVDASLGVCRYMDSGELWGLYGRESFAPSISFVIDETCSRVKSLIS